MKRGRGLACTAAFALVAALAAGPVPAAMAATANGSQEYCTGGDYCRYFQQPRLRVEYVAGAGESNVVSVPTEPSGVGVRDDGALITASGRCRSVSPNQAACGPPEPEGIVFYIATGDRDDRLTLGERVSSATLGSGQDLAVGTATTDSVDAGSGRDRLDGRGGADILRGGRGADVVRGGDGNDDVVGNGGRDRLLGGPGRDTVSAADRRRDRINCGSGRDRVVADRYDLLRGCERRRFPRRRR